METGSTPTPAGIPPPTFSPGIWGVSCRRLPTSSGVRLVERMSRIEYSLRRVYGRVRWGTDSVISVV